MIYYFSGTGNSRYVAQKIGETLDMGVFDLGERIRRGVMDAIQDDTIVVVTPTYCWRLPRLVERYLRQLSISAERLYFVLTCGSGIGNAEHYAEELAMDLDVDFGGVFKVLMPENYIAMFDVPIVEESRVIIDRAQPRIADIAESIKKGKKVRRKAGIVDRILSSINGLFYSLFVKADAFYVEENCIGCGECERRCSLANVIMEGGRPHWLDRCTHCMACINYCPVEAIEYGKKTKGKFRYTLEKVKDSECFEK